MDNQENNLNENSNNNVDVSIFGLNTFASWIVFSILLILGIILLPYLMNLIL